MASTANLKALEIWRLTGAAYQVISHGAMKGRIASISAADCFAPVVLPYASLALLRRTSGIRELYWTSYLADSPNGSVYRSSREPVHPPMKDYLQASASTVLQISSQSGRALSLADTRLLISKLTCI
ncbi:hypothetical protein AMECASPLE_036645 [Ameca splendens]|uniref:Uncharacterized protein n=1 Tax=Ameca splendens TaxID=208324 RepID=A0ABV0Z626_9TELE